MLRNKQIQEAGQRRAEYVMGQFIMTPMGSLYLSCLDNINPPTCDSSFQPTSCMEKATNEDKMEFNYGDSADLYKLATDLQFFKERMNLFMQGCKLTREGMMSLLTDTEIGELYVASIMRNYYSTIGKRA